MGLGPPPPSRPSCKIDRWSRKQRKMRLSIFTFGAIWTRFCKLEGYKYEFIVLPPVKCHVSFREKTSSSHLKGSPSLWLHNKSRLFQWCLYNKQNITHPLVDMNFIFFDSTRSHERAHSLVRYRVENSKIKFISTRWHVISSISLSADAWACEQAHVGAQARAATTRKWPFLGDSSPDSFQPDRIALRR